MPSSVVTLVASVLVTLAVVAAAMWWWRRRFYHVRLRELAEALGLTYTQHNRDNPGDRFAWDVAGEWRGRAVKLARVPEGFLATQIPFARAFVLSMEYEPPAPLAATIGFPAHYLHAPQTARPQTHIGELGLWLEEGELEPGTVAELDLLRILRLPEMRQTGVAIKNGKARLFYDRGSDRRNGDPAFVERALLALAALAEVVESPTGRGEGSEA